MSDVSNIFLRTSGANFVKDGLRKASGLFSPGDAITLVIPKDARYRRIYAFCDNLIDAEVHLLSGGNLSFVMPYQKFNDATRIGVFPAETASVSSLGISVGTTVYNITPFCVDCVADKAIFKINQDLNSGVGTLFFAMYSE